METRDQLLESAGELFAEQGFDASSTRSICERAQVNLGSIHYYFGGKKELYIACFRRACGSDAGEAEREAILSTAQAQDKESISAAIVALLHNSFQRFFLQERPSWQQALIAREITNPSSVVTELIDEIFRTQHRHWLYLHQMIAPQATALEAHLWALQVPAQMVFYLNARQSLSYLTDLPIDEYFFKQALRHIARAMISAHDLPMPKELP